MLHFSFGLNKFIITNIGQNKIRNLDQSLRIKQRVSLIFKVCVGSRLDLFNQIIIA